MAVKIGSARSSFGNTAAGDQHSGLEVSTQNYYVHSLGWRIFRANDPSAREMIAKAMELACSNNDIGYSQGTRNTLTENVKPFGYNPSKTTKKVNTDCSALVRCCCLYAGINVEDFYTANEPSKLLSTDKFTEMKGDKYTKKSDYLCRGDIMVTCTKGHTVVVITNGSKCEDIVEVVSYALGDRILSNGSEGDDVKELQNQLISLGYSCGDWGADGDYGDCTEMAVTKFQQDHGLVANGVASAETISKIIAASGNDGEPVSPTSVTIIGGNCYIRSEPNTSGEKLGVAKKGGSYLYANEKSLEGWLKIVMYDNHTTGWVSGKYSQLK